jgi:hypothetical protein
VTDRPERRGNGGAFFSSGFLTFRNGVPDPAQVEALRARLGDDFVDRMLRRHELRRNPPPLTEEERAVLDAAMDPVLADLRAVGAIVPGVRYEAWEGRGPDYVCAWITPPGPATGKLPGGSNGVSVARFCSAGKRVAELADQVQEWEVEALAAAGCLTRSALSVSTARSTRPGLNCDVKVFSTGTVRPKPAPRKPVATRSIG